jgi:hypothetical protein
MQNIKGSHDGAVQSLRESNVEVGDVESLSKEGKIVGEIAFSVLNGQKPQGIPIAKGATDYMFDWRALHPWGIKESDFRPGVWFSTGNQASGKPWVSWCGRHLFVINGRGDSRRRGTLELHRRFSTASFAQREMLQL